jgi:hypothetical protein
MEDQCRSNLDDAYLKDESLPAEVFKIIQKYREKSLTTNTNGKSKSALIIDDFFGDIHRVLRD